ncbi:MAG TPA: phosphate acyltransferase PlsX [Chloroflexi bacterium]|nr:phosphate acyltransferase PlsX [Chloroflexota bacterium]
MRIVLDAMGSDKYPDPEIQAAVNAVQQFGDDILLVGNEELLKPKLELLGGSAKVKIIHAPEVLEMTDKPARSARGKAQNSMAVGMDLLKSGEGDAFVTAGNTGGAMANGLFRLGRIRGVKRPALTGILPVQGGYCVVLDIGANADCKPEYLVQFAVMGSLYAEKIRNIKNPRVGLMSNGEEAGKGNELVKATYNLLQGSGVNFIGNVESKEVFGGHVDVVVMDGFTGNVFLKTSEAVAKFMTTVLKEKLTSGVRTTLGAALAKPAFDQLRQVMDPGEIGAVPLLGIDGLVFVGHGRSDAHALVNAIRAARSAVEANLVEAVTIGIQQQMEASPEEAP